jgi:membrane-bound lytic murein transglycosylase D
MEGCLLNLIKNAASITIKRIAFACAAGTFLIIIAGCSTAPVKHSDRASGTHETHGDDSAKAHEDKPDNLWVRLRRGFSMLGKDRPLVKQWIAFYTTPPSLVENILANAAPYLWRITEDVSERGMPLEIALLPAVESGFNPYAYSPAHAAGLWQFIPKTARRFGLQKNWWYDGRRDPISATHAALDYLQFLHQLLGTWPRALAGYNCGEDCVQKAMDKNVAHGKPVDFWDLSLYKETENYVPKLLAVSAIVAHPGRYGITLPTLPNKPHLKQVKVPGQINLARAAGMAGVNVKKVLALNAGNTRWATAPNGPHRLLLPADHAKQFKAALAKLPPQDRVNWHRHRIKAGDNLAALAQQYDTTVQVLKRVNHLSGTSLTPGRELLIPAFMHSVDTGTMALIAKRRPRPRVRHAPHHKTKHYYRVKRGDTLSQVARAHRVSVGKLARWNGISRHSTLYIGQKLALYGAPTHKPKTTQYTVKSGDSLYAIAKRFHVSISELRRWNHLKGHTLRPGQRLALQGRASKGAQTTHYTVKTGDSLYAIANRFDTSVSELQDWNDMDGYNIRPGETLKVEINQI